MRPLTLAAVAFVAIVGFSHAHAQGFSGPELDRMSKERLDNGDFRGFASGPAPAKRTVPLVLHQPPGVWVCMGTDDYAPIFAEPRVGAPAIAQSSGQIAAGADQGVYTSVLIHEGRIGYIQRSTIHPYRNAFKVGATCTFEGLRPNGMVTFDVR